MAIPEDFWIVAEPFVEELKPHLTPYLCEVAGKTPVAERALHLRRVNVFVGANNSGKSRFMRALVSAPRVAWSKGEDEARAFAAFCCALKTLLAHPRLPQAMQYWEAKYDGHADGKGGMVKVGRLEYIVQRLNSTFGKGVPEQGSLDRNLLFALSNVSRLPRDEFDDLRGLLENIWIYSGGTKSFRPEQAFMAINPGIYSSECSRVYVPVLRSAARLASRNDANDIGTLEQSATKNYFLEIPSRPSLATGEDLYFDFLEMITGKRENRQRVHLFEEFLSRNFFQSRSVSVVPQWHRTNQAGSHNHLCVTIDSDERPLHDLGDGVGGIISLLAPFFLADEGTWIAIEEPENSLHPGFQRQLLEAILTDEYIKSRNITTLLTTHSNHLLGVVSQYRDAVTVHQFRGYEKSSPGTQQFVYRELGDDFLSTLDALGVHNSSVLLAGCTIWVEGPSDRDYVRGALRAYAKAHEKEPLLKEDLHFAFFEYGGALIQHYTFERDTSEGKPSSPSIFALALTNKIFLITDRDLDEYKQERFDDLQRVAQGTDALMVLQTEGVEIENELPPLVWKRLVVEVLKYWAPGAGFSVGEQADYKDTRMGTHLKARLDGHLSRSEKSPPVLVEKPPKTQSPPYNQTLTSSRKKEFSSAFLRGVDASTDPITWKDIEKSPLGKMALKVVDFIKKRNGLVDTPKTSNATSP